MGAEQSNSRSNNQRPQMSANDVHRLLEAQRQKYEQKCQEMVAEAAKRSATQAATKAAEQTAAQAAAQPAAQAAAQTAARTGAQTTAQNSAQTINPSLERHRSPYQYTAQDLYNVRESTTSALLYPNLNQAAGCSSSAAYTMNFQNNQNHPNLRPPQDFVFVNNYGQVENRFRPAPSAPRERSVSRSRNNGNGDDDLSCPTCRSQMGLTIYQCSQGHSACNACKISGRICRICGQAFTDRRNYALEGFIAQRKVACPHKSEGCKLFISIADMDTHIRECPFKEQQCPLASVFQNCHWRGKLSQIKNHFDNMHPAQRKIDVDTEMRLLNICNNSQHVHLVVLGVYNFVFHIKVSEADCKVYMTVQLIGTKMSASKWLYEIHVYNKSENRRKYTFTDSCSSSNESIDDIFKYGRCAVLPVAYASTFVNEGALTYKFFIKKSNEGMRVFNKNKNQHGIDDKKPEKDRNERHKSKDRSRQRKQSPGVFVNKKS